MAELWETVASLALALHSDRIEAIAAMVSGIPEFRQYHDTDAAFGPGIDPVLIDKLKKAWANEPDVPGREISSALRAAARTAAMAEAAETIDLVWTGPKTGLIPTRNTEQAIKEVIEHAERDVFIVSYVFHNATTIVESLNTAVARGVAVRILLESSIEQGGVISGDGLGAMRRAVPCSELYIWHPTEKAKGSGGFSASVHAKCAVADSCIAFVTSANLTSAAMERNMELGVLVRGGVTPHRLHSHLRALIQTGTIVAWK